MSRPIVAIVGRPNVGKSTFFNMLAGEKISIVDDTPGVTRDRIYADVEWLGKTFTLVDTGGIEIRSEDVLFQEMRMQAQMAIDTADVIIFLTDGREGLTDADGEVADLLRRSTKPIVLAVNKIDNYEKQAMDVYEFYNLGIGEPYPVSARGKSGVGDLLEAVASHFPEDKDTDEEDGIPRIAIIGKPNVGKSSIVNRLLGEKRMIVSDIPGTTRDAIDSRIRVNGKDYIFIDTAGLRRQNRRKEALEYYSVVRALSAVERADVALLVISAKEGVTEQDAKIAGIAHDNGKGVIIAVNKWDAVEKDNDSVKDYTRKIRETLSFMPYAPIVFISAMTGQRCAKIYPLVDTVLENRERRIPTGVLNEFVAEATALTAPPTDKGKRLKIFYATQVGQGPPTFVFFVNDKELMHFSYQRYLENRIRESFDFDGTSIRFLIRERKEKET
ncbi:MAG: ribosome biogenesis GTPase Der [Lachnospiraceae bacterium]|nr:ribosome biogenesis GTPase Der [Lachnospiraceae bacterium]